MNRLFCLYFTKVFSLLTQRFYKVRILLMANIAFGASLFISVCDLNVYQVPIVTLQYISQEGGGGLLF